MQLLVEAQKVETKVMEIKMTVTTCMAVAVGSSSSKEIQTPTKQISNLMSMVQGAKNKGGRSMNQGNSCNHGANTQSVVNDSGNQS